MVCRTLTPDLGQSPMNRWSGRRQPAVTFIDFIYCCRKLRAFYKIEGFSPHAPKKGAGFSPQTAKLADGFSPQEKFEGFSPEGFSPQSDSAEGFSPSPTAILPCYQLSPATNYRHQKIKRSYFSNGHIF